VSDSSEFRVLLQKNEVRDLSGDQIDRIVEFREEVLKENEIQNLTRLLSPKDFFEGHVLDVLHLEKSGLISFPCLDLGSGMGVPGLLYALLFGGEWIVCDSEAMKAQFMSRMIEKFGLNNIRAASERAEDLLDTQKVGSIVARAVGPVLRIFNWISRCSTWNNLILLKGPKWAEEWAEFQKTSSRSRLKLAQHYHYQVGEEQKQRIAVRLIRN